MPEAEIAVIGGTGLYRFLASDAEHVIVDTPYGPTSAPIEIATVGHRRVAVLPRHGAEHSIAPHRIPFRANIWALEALGVTRILAPCAVGSLRPDRRPGDVVVCDQFVDRTWGRPGSFFLDGPEVGHVSSAEPYCAELRPLAATACRDGGMTAHDEGTVVVIQGPRFNTRAESRWFATAGGDVVNMTQCPEAILARELGVCYVALALVTDYDSGIDHDPTVGAVTQDEVLRVFGAATEKLAAALRTLIASVPDEPKCGCAAGRAKPLH